MNIKNIVIMVKYIVSLHIERIPLGGDIKLRESAECVVVKMVNGDCYIIPYQKAFITEGSKTVEAIDSIMNKIRNGITQLVLPDTAIYQEPTKGE